MLRKFYSRVNLPLKSTRSQTQVYLNNKPLIYYDDFEHANCFLLRPMLDMPLAVVGWILGSPEAPSASTRSS